MNQMKEIPCPNCGGQILFDPELLVGGQSFSCNDCRSTISIAQGSISQAREAMDKFNTLKNNSK